VYLGGIVLIGLSVASSLLHDAIVSYNGRSSCSARVLGRWANVGLRVCTFVDWVGRRARKPAGRGDGVGGRSEMLGPADVQLPAIIASMKQFLADVISTVFMRLDGYMDSNAEAIFMVGI
jgi:hypothetical protein